MEALITQNDLGREGKLKIVKKYVNNKTESRKDKKGTIILETDAKTYKNIIEKGKVNLGWKRCQVFDFVSVIRCFKCWGFNHFSKDCKKEVMCKKCSGIHSSQNCSSTVKKLRELYRKSRTAEFKRHKY